MSGPDVRRVVLGHLARGGLAPRGTSDDLLEGSDLRVRRSSHAVMAGPELATAHEDLHALAAALAELATAHEDLELATAHEDLNALGGELETIQAQGEEARQQASLAEQKLSTIQEEAMNSTIADELDGGEAGALDSLQEELAQAKEDIETLQGDLESAEKAVNPTP
ncbi:hypothetical protein T484DRAFT_1844404 [Baffinella frigidus]|nr:hypothetical protein T484DRAFT_1844404 [Cryptophyta sp. CCMP2293]